jgi:hypothetical protein
MFNLDQISEYDLLSEISPEVAANINGGQSAGQPGGQGETAGGGSNGSTGQGKFNKEKYQQALGLAYLSPPAIGRVTDDEALLAQFVAWED